MSLILPLAFYSTSNQQPVDVSGAIYSVYTAPLGSPYPDYNFVFGSISDIQTVSFSGAALLNNTDDPDTYWKPRIQVQNGDFIKAQAVSAGNGSDFRFIVGGIMRFSDGPNIFLNVVNLSASSPGVFSDPTFFSTAAIPDNVVNTILLDDKIYVGGQFTKTGTSIRQRFAAYNRNGTLAATTANANNTINAIKINPLNTDEIFIAGDFTVIKSITKRGIAKINKNTNANTTFNANGIFKTAIQVNALEVQSDGKIIVGTAYQTDQSKILTRLASTTISTTKTYESFSGLFSPNTLFGVNALKIDNNGKLLASVTILPFGSSNSQERLYRFNLTGTPSIDTTFASPDYYIVTSGDFSNPGKRFIYDISFDSSDNIIIVGNFLKVAGIDRANFAVLDNSGVLQ